MSEIIAQSTLDSELLSNHKKIYAKFEPIVTKTLEVYSYEILLRLNNIDNSHIDFLKKLRERGETFRLFIRIANKAFEVSRTWIGVNINLEVRDVLNPDFLSFLKKLLEIYKIDSSKINFELLEYEDLEKQDIPLIISKIKEINNLWFLFSIDDLYSWHSNKRRIKILLDNWIKISMVKIDWKFFKEMFDSYNAWFSMPDIIKHDWEKYFKYSLNDFDDFKNYIWELHEKWIKVVAEWVENKEMFDFAIELWFDYFQWYYIQNLNNSIEEI